MSFICLSVSAHHFPQEYLFPLNGWKKMKFSLPNNLNIIAYNHIFSSLPAPPLCHANALPSAVQIIPLARVRQAIISARAGAEVGSEIVQLFELHSWAVRRPEAEWCKAVSRCSRWTLTILEEICGVKGEILTFSEVVAVTVLPYSSRWALNDKHILSDWTINLFPGANRLVPDTWWSQTSSWGSGYID